MLRSFLVRPVSLAFALIALAPPVFGQAPAGRRLAIEDYYRVTTVGGITLSPDERWVGFTVSTRVEQSNGTYVEVWLVPADGSAAARRISAPGVNSVGPSWMDDGRIRFSTPTGVRVVTPTAPARIDTLLAPNIGGAAAGRGGGGGRGGGAQSPDGSMTAVVRNMPVAPRPALALTDFEKRHFDRFQGVQFDWLDFHRDGAAFPAPNTRDPQSTPPQEIFLTFRDGGAERQLTRLGLRPTGVQWLRDGRSLIFSADSTYRNERLYGRTDIWQVTSNGVLKRLTSGNVYDYDGARLSPDGRWILATRRTSTDEVIAKKMNNGGPVDIVVFPIAGGPEKVLTADWDYLPATQQWSPDGRHIYFTGGVGGTTHLFRVSPDAGAVEQLTRGERDIASLTFNRTYTKILYTVGTFEAPSELYIANIDGSGERKLTNVHAPFTTEVALSRAERLRFNSKDGTPVEGWLTFPHGYTAGGGPYPMIVSNHGGPHSAIQYGFNFKNQYFAANGYFVLEVNFRGSTGYGEKFLWGIWGAWGDRDGEDVIAGIDHAIGRFAIDRNRVGSIGHSYGGFMTNWLIVQYPERIKAAVSGAGVVNWMSDYGNADISRTKETEFYGPPWDERARAIMVRQSPLTYAHRARAPTLFINGELDKRVPYSENEQMYKALQKIGVPSKMIVYADQSHGISGHWNNVHRMLNERMWFDRHLR